MPERVEVIRVGEGVTFNTPLEMLPRRRGGLDVACGALSILRWRCTEENIRRALDLARHFQYSVGDAGFSAGQAYGQYATDPFNTPLEMLGLLVFGFCGFLSFCVGVCGFLVGAC